MPLDLIGVIFIFSLIVGVVINFIGFPGNALISFNSLVYALLRNFEGMSWKLLIMVFGIALLIEFLEFLAISFASQKFGASKKAVWGAFIGGALGAISGFFVTPVLGSFIGSVAGVLIGAFFLELFEKRELRAAFLAVLGAFLGKIGGLTVKVVGSVVLATTILYNLIG